MFNLNGKTALITGATRGIGKEIAIALHNAGAEIIISATKQETLNQALKTYPQKAHAIAANLNDNDAIDKLTKNAEEITGAIDILVNNAGITKDQLAMRMSDEEWQSIIQVNLTAPFRISKNLLRGMMKRRHGRIINIASIVGSIGNPGQANYAAAKAGIIGLGKSMAKEVASRGITVNAIAPGFIETDMTAELNQEVAENLKKQIPIGRMGQANEIAAAALFLASNEAAYITGETIHVNGGLYMP